jgi:hypothetical protein
MKELSKPQEYAILGAIFVFLSGGGGTFAVWAADQRYAQKQDIEALEDTVNKNTTAQQATVASVDVLLVQVLDIRIEELETEVRDLEAQDELTAAEASLLAQDKRALDDARAERNLTLQRILNRRTQ